MASSDYLPTIPTIWSQECLYSNLVCILRIFLGESRETQVNTENLLHGLYLDTKVEET